MSSNANFVWENSHLPFVNRVHANDGEQAPEMVEESDGDFHEYVLAE